MNLREGFQYRVRVYNSTIFGMVSSNSPVDKFNIEKRQNKNTSLPTPAA